MRAVAFAFALMIAGCYQVSPAGPCIADPDCGEGGVCTRLGECIAEDEAISVRIAWTIDGVAPSPADPAACEGIDRLAVTFSDLDADDETTFEPVACETGQIYFDTMPPTIDQVEVIALDAARIPIARQSRDLSGDREAELTFAL